MDNEYTCGSNSPIYGYIGYGCTCRSNSPIYGYIGYGYTCRSNSPIYGYIGYRYEAAGKNYTKNSHGWHKCFSFAFNLKKKYFIS